MDNHQKTVLSTVSKFEAIREINSKTVNKGGASSLCCVNNA